MPTKCEIVSVGKRRDGGTKYWCLIHKGDATAKYGVPAQECRYANWPIPTDEETLKIEPAKYLGGIALWGAVPPVYDTTSLPFVDRGIHVHARETKGGQKVIDKSYRKVIVSIGKNGSSREFPVLELDAIYYMVSTVLGYEMCEVICTRCGYSHLDKDWFSVNMHLKHLCSGCGYTFKDMKLGIGNPLVSIRNAVEGSKKRTLMKANRKVNFKQADFPLGIQVWGSNPAIIWTGSQSEEEGIHVHAFKDSYDHPAIDNTYDKLVIDGIELNPEMVRTMMGQSGLPHITRRLVSEVCPKCKAPHFDTGKAAHFPSEAKECKNCGNSFASTGRLKRVISNPMIDVIGKLVAYAPRPLQKHDLGLLPETIAPL